MDPEKTCRVPGDVEMEAFDRLPPMLRDALNYHPGPVSAAACFEALQAGLPPMTVLAMVYDTGREHYGIAQDGWRTRRAKPCQR